MPGKGNGIGTWGRLRGIAGCFTWFGLWLALFLLAAMRTLAWWVTEWAREIHPLLALMVYYFADVVSLCCAIGFVVFILFTTPIPEYGEEDDDVYPPFIQ